MANNLVPIQTCKLPSPTTLKGDESREQLTTWMDSAANFFSRDDAFSHFVLPASRWDPTAANWGFAAEGEGARLNRTAAQMHAAFQRFCAALTSFFPYSFLTRNFQQTRSWNDIKQSILRGLWQQAAAHMHGQG